MNELFRLVAVCLPIAEPVVIEELPDFADVCECGFVMPLKVLRSAAGYYLGHVCDNCGPFDRITDYMSKKDAELALDLFMGKEL